MFLLLLLLLHISWQLFARFAFYHVISCNILHAQVFLGLPKKVFNDFFRLPLFTKCLFRMQTVRTKQCTKLQNQSMKLWQTNKREADPETEADAAP